VSAASLREELERLQALDALAGPKLHQRSGGSTDLIHWEDKRPEQRRLVAKHLARGDVLRVSRAVMPDWVAQQYGDPSQVDGRVLVVDAGPNHNLSGMKLQTTLWHVIFSVTADEFIDAVLKGDVLDAT
jgi:hypothetical protein